jgi:SAM-dependent MidA family methyltransferase
MQLALYHPEHGYYARAPQRSGRAGDFYTSVDVGPLFGETIAAQLAEMWTLLRSMGIDRFDVVEVGAGNGRLARDVMDAAARDFPALYDATRLILVERSGAARNAQADQLGPHVNRLHAMQPTLPSTVTGVIYANELLDAFPVHVVTRTPEGLQEIAVSEREGTLVETFIPLSTPALLDFVRASGAAIEVGARIEVPLAALQWVAQASAALSSGFLLLFDYGGEASQRYTPARAGGTLTTYQQHRSAADGWLTDPGERDLTADVDLTAVRRTAEAAGLVTAGIVDQTYFLLSLGLAERLETGHDRRAVAQRLAARTLIMPGGLGSTMKVMVFARNAGRPVLRGLSSGRLT